MTTEYTPEQIFYRFILAKGETIFNDAQKMSVMVFNLNQVGCLTAEILARCSIGSIILIDDSAFQENDIHGYFVSNKDTIGLQKGEIVQARIKDINPSCNAIWIKKQPTLESFTQSINEKNPQIAIDCTDDTSIKQAIVQHCINQKQKLITICPTFNMKDPRQITSSPLNHVHHCMVAKQLKKQLGIQDTDFYDYIMAVYSMEVPVVAQNQFCYGPVQNLIAIRAVYSVINYIAEGQLVNPKENKQYQPKHKNNKQ